MRLSGAFLLLVALDALQIHHLFRFQLALFFQRLDRIGLLGKDLVADVAVADSILVLGMGKRHLSRCTTIDQDFFRPLFDRSGAGTD